MTLNSFNMSDNIINLIAYDKKKELYFPYKNNKFAFTETEKFIKEISIIENEIERVKITQFKASYYINYLSAKSNEFNFNPSIDLGVLFDKLHTDNILSLIKYRTSNNIYYKINKDLLSTLTEDELHKMKRIKQQSKIESSFIQLKYKFTEESYCSLFISNTFNYHIKFNLKKKEKITISKIESFYNEFNKIIRVANSCYSDLEMPLIAPDNINIIEMTTNNFITYEKNVIKYDKFIDIIKNKLYPYFNILSSNDNIIFLQYKKIDNYILYENIQAYITRNYKLDKEDVIVAIMNEFLILEDEALKEYEKWKRLNEVE
jgi:hypothetical protein